MTKVVAVTPLVAGKPLPQRSFFTVTKDITASGLSFIANQPFAEDEVLVAIGIGEPLGENVYLRGEVRHQEPMGGGFTQVGVRLLEIFDVTKYPELTNAAPECEF